MTVSLLTAQHAIEHVDTFEAAATRYTRQNEYGQMTATNNASMVCHWSVIPQQAV